MSPTFGLSDYHVHTPMCRHATGSIEEYIRAAVARGMEQICFTDHIPLPDGVDGELRMSLDDLDIYLGELDEARSRHQEIEILIGIEADYIERYESYLAQLIQGHPFDYVLMSIHTISFDNDRSFDKDRSLDKDRGYLRAYDYLEGDLLLDAEQVCAHYFASALAGIRTGLFDAVAHLDLIKHPDLGVPAGFDRHVDTVIDAAASAGMAIELNTSGRRKRIGEYYPSPAAVRRIIDAGVPLVLGSDAHAPEHVGFELARALEQITRLPGARLARYRRREQTVLPASDVRSGTASSRSRSRHEPC